MTDSKFILNEEDEELMQNFAKTIIALCKATGENQLEIGFDYKGNHYQAVITKE